MPTLEITTMVGCPVMCSFCPQDNLRNAYNENGADKYLSYENFTKIIDKVPLNVQIDFSGMAEPWVNDHCTEMVKYVLMRGYNIAVYTTLYNMKRDEVNIIVELLKKYSSQVKELVIHLQDKNLNMKGLKFSDDWIFTLNEFINLYNSKVMPNMYFMTMDEEAELHPNLSSLQNVVAQFKGISRAGSLDINKVNGQKVIVINNKKGIIKCSYTDYYDHNVLLPNGDVLVCCMDYNKKHNFGNLLEQDYFEIFKSKGYTDLITKNMNALGENNNSICRQCERAVKAIG